QQRKIADVNGGSEEVNPVTLTPLYGALIQERLIPEPAWTSTYLANITIGWDAGFAKLVSVSSFHRRDARYIREFRTYFKTIVPYYFSTPAGIGNDEKISYDTVAQEVRLSSEEGSTLQWQVGGYFTEERSKLFAGFCPIDIESRNIVCNVLTDPSTLF